MPGAAPPLPQTFGKYTLVERIAAGGMAEVYRAKIYGVAGFEKTLAIKRILPHFAGDKGFVQMFVREANVAVRLSHANVVHVFELGRVGEDYYIALEFVEGKDLKTLIRKAAERNATLPPALSAFIAQKICAGLHAAHTATDDAGQPLGIVHRDVSPHNVLLSWNGEVKVADFGIAKLQSASRHTRTGTIKGKLAYMSPEQSEGDPSIDARSDIFAMGIVLYEMLTGSKPFDGETDREILKKRREDRYPDCASMARALAGYLQKSGALLDEEAVAEAMRVLAGPRPVTPPPSARGGGTPVLPDGAADAPAPAGVAAGGGEAEAAVAASADDAPTRPTLPEPGAGGRSVEVFAAAEPTVIKPLSAPAPRIDTGGGSQATLSRGGTGSATTPSERVSTRTVLLGALGLVAALAGAFVLGSIQHGAASSSPAPTATSTVVASSPVTPSVAVRAGASPAPVAPTTGTVRVTGTPAGALVTVDKTRTAHVGDAIEGLAFGHHTIVVSADDYRPKSVAVDLSAASPEAAPSVALARGKGEIRVGHGSSNQYRVTIVGVTRPGQELEARFEGVDAGRYTATIRLGARHWEIPVVVRDGAVTKVRLDDDVGTLGSIREFRPE